MQHKDLSEYLATWETLNTWVMELTEETCKELLELEKQNGRRPQFLLRIYGRYNKLRCERERGELLQRSKKK